MGRSDWQAVVNPVKDDWKSTTTVNGEQSVMTTLTLLMRQWHVFSWDLGKLGVSFLNASLTLC